MQLPDQLGKNFLHLCGKPPRIAVRALYNLDGELGATWLAVGEERIVFYYRPSGGSFCRKAFRLNEVIECKVKADPCFAVIHFRFAAAQYELKCSQWDLPALDRIAGLFTAEADSMPLEAPARLNPASAFCAGIHAVMGADGQVDPVETEWLSRRIPAPEAIQEGSAWLRVHQLDKLLEEAPRILNDAQCECLVANQLSAVMSDGLLRSAERDLVERFQNALNLTKDRFNEIFEILLSRNQVAVLANDADGEMLDLSPTAPLVLFTAALLAMSRCDAEKQPAEEDYLNKVINHPEVIEEAEEALNHLGLDGLLEALPNALDDAQRQCLMANLLGLSMADGELRVEEQELIDQFCAALLIPEAGYQRIYSVLLAKNNLSVLA